MLGIALWGIMQFLRFAFYVIEKYVDGRHRFAGLGSFLEYMLKRGAGNTRPTKPPAVRVDP